MPDGPAAPSIFNATDWTSGPVICSYMTGWGLQGRDNQRRQSWTDQHIWLPGVSVSVVRRCRSLLLSFSICHLGILGLEGTINCILARTSHQRTTSEKRTKALLPKCPLFGGSTVVLFYHGCHVASYPGLLAPAFVACSTNAGEGLVKLSHVV